MSGSPRAPWTGKTVLVTGGAGFLGSHIVDRQLGAGHRVIVLDNMQTGSLDNLAAHDRDERLSVVHHDVAVPFDFDVQAIFNLACPASPAHYGIDPVRTMRTCVMGMLNTLELAKRRSATVVHASTSEVYGDPLSHPQHESHWGNVNPIGVRACYDEGKRAAETLCFDYRRLHGLDVKVARIFNTYGPRMHPADGRVVANFIVQALRQEPLTVYGDGRQTRSFCYVDDLIDALISLSTTPPVVAGPVNIGSTFEFTMLELAALVRTQTRSMSSVAFLPLPEDDPRQRRPDISLAKQLLGWHPTTDLQAGLQITIDYFRRRLSLP